MVYDEIIRLAEETQKIARDQKAQHYTHQTIDRMRLERIKELVEDCKEYHEKIKEYNDKLKTLHDRINCVYAGEEDHLLIEHVLHKRTITNTVVSQVSETKRTQKGFHFTHRGKQVIKSKL